MCCNLSNYFNLITIRLVYRSNIRLEWSNRFNCRPLFLFEVCKYLIVSFCGFFRMNNSGLMTTGAYYLISGFLICLNGLLFILPYKRSNSVFLWLIGLKRTRLPKTPFRASRCMIQNFTFIHIGTCLSWSSWTDLGERVDHVFLR